MPFNAVSRLQLSAAGGYPAKFVRLIANKNPITQKTSFSTGDEFWGVLTYNKEGKVAGCRIRNSPELLSNDRLREKATGNVYKVRVVIQGIDELIVSTSKSSEP